MDTNQIQAIKQRYKIVGNSDGLNRALDVAIQVAPTDLSVLIIGESGVGKEIIPRVIHDNSTRKHNKYIAINCGSIPEGTIESELFGHAKGSFTGAVGEREGYFGAANGGTLFLDEVGELPLATQARLLRVLETGEYIRVGENEPKKTNVRIIAATNVNMQKAMREGKFREDLYYRLNTIPVSLPPLRERGRDIEMLFRSFAREMAEKYSLPPITLTDSGRELLLAYKWPGNIRELRNRTEQICIISKEREITSEILQELGLTYDNTGETGLVVQKPYTHNNQQSEQTYEKERVILFEIINRLRNEVQEMKELLQGQMGNVPTHVQDHIAHTVISAPNVATNATTFDEINISHINTPRSQTDDNYTHIGNNIHISSITPEQEPIVQHIEETPLTIREVEKIKIQEALDRNHNNRKKAAYELGISERTLYRKIKDYGINL